MVSAGTARADVIAAYSLVKTRLLAVPSAVGQRLPDLALVVVPVVEELVREALAELAVDGDAA
jgi:phage terminase Nu1 subunit (DNA packaging protein)